MASQQHRSSIAMDRELFRTVRQASLNHARLLYHRLVRRLPHLLAVTLLVAAAQLAPVPSPSTPLAAARTLLREAAARADVWLVAVALAACACAYAASRPRPVYLVDLAAYRPGPAHRATRAESVRHFALAGRFTDESVAFQTRMLERAGVGDATHFPASILADPVDMSLRAAREETEAVVFGVVDDLLRATGVRAAEEIGIVIVNSSLFSPTPSFTSLIVNRYGLRHDVVTHNLSGMGCSAGIIAIDLAKHLLQVHPDTYALVVSTENITLNAYLGNHRPMLVTNTLFRMGGAAVLLSNRAADSSRAKYRLLHTVRTHRGGASDDSYACVTQEEDAEGNVGVSLAKNLMSVAGDALRSNITTLGPLVLPLSEQLRFLGAVLLRRVAGGKAKVKPYVPDFKLALEHFCIHAGGRGVLDELERSLGLSAWDMEPSRMTLYRFGNTSSSSLWYELAYCEAKGRIKKGDRVWQIAFGSGFKCNSAVWKALRTVDDAGGRGDTTNPWADDIHDLPVHVPKVSPFASSDRQDDVSTNGQHA